MFVIKWILWFFVWRARRLFGLVLVAMWAKPVGRVLLRLLNVLSGFTGAILKLGVKNPDVHGVMLGITLALMVTLLDWSAPMGKRGYLCVLGMCLFTIFLLDSLTFELVREKDEDEERAKRIRKAFREAMWIGPVVSQLLAFYAFGTQTYLIQVLVDLWMNAWEIFEKIFLWFLGGPPGGP